MMVEEEGRGGNQKREESVEKSPDEKTAAEETDSVFQGREKGSWEEGRSWWQPCWVASVHTLDSLQQ